MIHMQEGEPRCRPNSGPRARDIEQGGRDTQVSAGLLKLPGEAAEPDAVYFRAGQHRDGISAAGLDRRRDVVESAVYRHAGHLTALAWLHHAGADHGKPVIPITMELFN